MRLGYYVSEQLQTETFGPAGCVDNEWDACILGSGGGGEGVAVEGYEVDNGCYIVGGIFARRGIAGVVSAEGSGGVRVCEWGAKDGSCEVVEGDKAGGGELGLTGVTIKVSDGCMGGRKGEECVN